MAANTEVLLPTYEYRCEAESHRFELRQSFDSDPVHECPECGSVSRRVFHAPAVVFKGSGFYVNDYGKKGGNMGSSSSSSGNGKSSSDGEKSASKSDSKAKSDSKSDSKKATASSDS